MVLALLLFISAFTECHLDRCVASYSSSESSPILLQITLLLRELAALTCASCDPQVSYESCSMYFRECPYALIMTAMVHMHS